MGDALMMIMNKLFAFFVVAILCVVGVYAEDQHNCRLLGSISNNFPTDLLDKQLYNDSASLRVLGTTNIDGWGAAYYYGYTNNASFVRGKINATNDTMFIEFTSNMSKNEPNILIGHVRTCTSGCCAHDFTIPDPHPFYRYKNGRMWTFEHNGGITISSVNESIDPSYWSLNPLTGSDVAECTPATGNLVIDSEVWFSYVMQQIEAFDWNVTRGIANATLKLINTGLGTSSINFVLSDGEKIWGFKYGYTLYYTNTSDYSTVASQPTNTSLTSSWTQMSDYELVELSNNSVPIVYDVRNLIYHPLMDFTGINKNITIDGAYYNYTDESMNFDSATDILNISYENTLNITDAFTFVAWVKPGANYSSSSPRVFNKEDSGSAASPYSFQIGRDSRDLYTCLKNGSSENCISGSGGHNVYANNWTFIGYTYNGSHVRYYINGVNVTNTTYIGPLNNTNKTKIVRIYVGNTHSKARAFNGSIDEVLFYNVTKSDADILYLYNRGRNNHEAPDLTNALIYLPFNNYIYEAVAATIADQAEATTYIVFAAFGLFALICVALAAFSIISFMRGSGDATTIMIAIASMIGLGLVLLVGYYILGALVSAI